MEYVGSALALWLLSYFERSLADTAKPAAATGEREAKTSRQCEALLGATPTRKRPARWCWTAIQWIPKVIAFTYFFCGKLLRNMERHTAGALTGHTVQFEDLASQRHAWRALSTRRGKGKPVLGKKEARSEVANGTKASFAPMIRKQQVLSLPLSPGPDPHERPSPW